MIRYFAPLVFFGSILQVTRKFFCTKKMVNIDVVFDWRNYGFSSLRILQRSDTTQAKEQKGGGIEWAKCWNTL